jgi:cytochrome c oxidase subunit 3
MSRPVHIHEQKGLCYGIVLSIFHLFLIWRVLWVFYPPTDEDGVVPTHGLGGCWPLTDIHPLNAPQLQLLNPSVYLIPGSSITCHNLIEGNHKHIKQGILITSFLGACFILVHDEKTSKHHSAFLTTFLAYHVSGIRVHWLLAIIDSIFFIVFSMLFEILHI